MQAVTGVVADHYTKMKSTRYGDKNIHWYRMEDGTEFNTGFKPAFSKGENIDIAVDMKYGSLQYEPGVKAPAGGTAAPVTKPAYTPKGKGAFPVDPKDGQISIIRQSSLARAHEAVSEMIALEIFTPETETQYLKKVLEVALIYTDYASGNDIMKFTKEMEDE